MVPAKSTRSKSIDENPKPNFNAPEVIVDFIFDQGLFFIAVKNISDRPAYKVSVKFSKKIYGLGGTRDVTTLPLFRNIEFLAPQKEIATFLDTSDSYFGRKQPTKVEARISYHDAEGAGYRVSIMHDLEIYRDLALTGRPESVVVSNAPLEEGE